MGWRFVLSAALVLFCAQGAFAEEGKAIDKNTPAPICTPESKADIFLAGRGCCSHHKGQCGCQGGRVVCCDGTLSPSCTCEADEGEELRIGEVVFP